MSASLPNFLYWLYHCAETGAAVLFWQLLRWVSFVIEWSDWSYSGSADVTDAPSVIGASGSRARKISIAFKEQVGEAAASGKAGRSVKGIIESAKVFKPQSQLAVVGGWGGKWRQIWLDRYFLSGQDIFRSRGYWSRVLSLACDGVRISFKSSLIATVFSYEKQVAMWLPPMVRFGKSIF